MARPRGTPQGNAKLAHFMRQEHLTTMFLADASRVGGAILAKCQPRPEGRSAGLLSALLSCRSSSWDWFWPYSWGRSYSSSWVLSRSPSTNTIAVTNGAIWYLEGAEGGAGSEAALSRSGGCYDALVMATGTCDSCGYNTEVERREADGGTEQTCKLCRETGADLTSPHDIGSNAYQLNKIEIQRTICYVGNAILDALKK